MQRVLLTGAGGDIGGSLRKLLKPIYPELRTPQLRYVVESIRDFFLGHPPAKASFEETGTEPSEASWHR